MPNNYFQFKHFRIEQGSCAMKVSTDACVLGAAAELAGARRILDIGTGTGLLALMAAQRQPTAHVEAVEIDPAAAAQAAQNFAASPWSARLRLHPRSLADFAATHPASFDHILCNPPFFQASLPAPDPARRTARHAVTTSLTLAELARLAARFLHPAGQLTVLLPPAEMFAFAQQAAAEGLHQRTRLVLHHRAGSRPLRHIIAFGSTPANPLAEHHLFIRQPNSENHSPEFKALLTDFYLAF